MTLEDEVQESHPMYTGKGAGVEVIEAYGQRRSNRRVLVGSAEHTGPWLEGTDGLRRG